MDQGDLGGELGEEGRLLGGRIAAAHDGDLLAAVKMAVAGRAGAHAVAAVRAFDAQPSGRRARGDDQGVAGVVADRPARRDRRWGRRWSVTRNGRRDRSASKTVSHLQSAPNRCACLRIRSIRSGPMMPSGKPGKVVDGGRQGQLTARLLPLEDQGREVGPRGIKRGGQARRPRTDDDHRSMLLATSYPREQPADPSDRPSRPARHRHARSTPSPASR